jgi:hypothetical protein
MSSDARRLIVSAENAIGTDAYLVYPNNLRQIPEVVIWGFASACVLEFVKAFVDLKGIGEAARELVAGLLIRLKERSSFEEYCRTEGLDAAVLSAIATIPERIDEKQFEVGLLGLKSVLTQLGLPENEAATLSGKIGDAIRTHSVKR